jgi:hypothetical protein
MAKLTWKLSSPIFDDPERRAKLSKVVKEAAIELRDDIVLNIQDGNQRAAGITYRRGRITRAASKATKAIGLKHFTTASGKQKAITGYKFHRASAKGQSPAIDTGGLIGGISAQDLSELKSRVFSAKAYGAALDDPAGLDRPFFHVRVEKFRQRFLEKVREALR